MFPLCLSPDPTDGGASVEPTEPTVSTPESGGTPESTGETHDAAPQPEPADKQAAEGDQGASDIGPTIEALKRQLRAVTQERSAERQRANELEQQLQAARPQEPDGAPAIPGIPTHTAPPEGTSLKVISQLADPELAGLLYDGTDDTVCIGDPDNLADWVTPDVARKVAQANRLAAREADLQKQTAVHETYKAFEQFTQAMAEHGRKLREQVLPHITDEAAIEAADRQIAALTMQRMRDAGITVEGIASGEASIRDKAADLLAESVEDIRKVHVMFARDAGKTINKARATAPVRGGGGSGITGAKPLSEMTRGERRNYFQKVAENRLS